MVVYDPYDPHAHLYDVDNGEYYTDMAGLDAKVSAIEDTVITLADWYHQAAVVVQQGRPYVKPHLCWLSMTPDFCDSLPNSVLINGLGRWTGNLTSELAVINVEHGKRSV